MRILKPDPAKKQLKAFDSTPQNIICFSHLRWDFVFQRPQQLLTRLSKMFMVFFIEEPVCDAKANSHYTFLNRGENIIVVVPHIKEGLSAEGIKAVQKQLFDKFIENHNMADHIFWYYTPMALEFSRKYNPELTIYDCMDELSAFKYAPPELKTLEKELLKKADLVFTGGYSIYEAKKNLHANIHPFPSSIDREHFEKARHAQAAKNGVVTVGFFGVIDERFDIELVSGMASKRPAWQIVLIGPVVKVDSCTLPKNKNIVYTGAVNYNSLPAYISKWHIAIIPFLLNESTRFISPTKTPEYLAAGIPVISTPIKDVINPYAKNKLVNIGSNADDFIQLAEQELSSKQKDTWLKQVDAFLSLNSWDKTCGGMLELIGQTIKNRYVTSIAQ